MPAAEMYLFISSELFYMQHVSKFPSHSVLHVWNVKKNCENAHHNLPFIIMNDKENQQIFSSKLTFDIFAWKMPKTINTLSTKPAVNFRSID